MRMPADILQCFHTTFTYSPVFGVGYSLIVFFLLVLTKWRSNESAGAARAARHLIGAAEGQKLYLKLYKNTRENSDYKFHVFACNKNEALQWGVKLYSLTHSASAYLSSARSAITLGIIETYVLNSSPASKT